MANETPSRPPPPFMANAILNFHFDFLHTSLSAINCGLFIPRRVFHCEAAQMSFAKFFQQAGWHKLPYKTFVVKLKTILKLHKIHQPQSHLITASFLHISEYWWNWLS